MTSMGKDLYRTFKKSVGDAFGQSSSAVKYGGGSGKTWIHPPDVLINGHVEYPAKFFGKKDVDKAKGTETIRDAITAIRFQLQVKRGETGHSGAKLQRVDLHISVEGVTVVESKTKMVIHRYPLQRISFCADDKQDKRIFSFIAKAESPEANGTDRHECLVFLSDKMAEQITLSVGEAFDLAFKRYMDKNLASLENTKQILFLRKRIAELEAENQVLSNRLAEALRGNKAQQNLIDAPALPTSPMPRGPPVGILPNVVQADVYSTPHQQHQSDPFEDLITSSSQFSSSNADQSVSRIGTELALESTPPSGPAPTHRPPPCPGIAPPPPIVPRRQPPKNKNPTTATLEGVQFEECDPFATFDPRANEPKQAKVEEREANGYDPFGDDFLNDVLKAGDDASRATLERSDMKQHTADDFQKMIDKVDQRLAEMRNGFGAGNLETATGEMVPNDGSLRDLEESDYGTPRDRVNPDVITKK